MATNVDLGLVENGCAKIDNAIDMFENVKTSIINATEYLGYNSLRFGDIDSSLEEQLETLIAQVKNCIEMSEGVTATIRAKAETQYQEYQEYLRSLKPKEQDTTTEL